MRANVLWLAASYGLAATATTLKPWVDSTDGIHAFSAFDYAMSADEILSTGKHYDFVWGSRSKDMWKTSNLSTDLEPESSLPWGRGNPAAVRAWYVPFNIDLRPRNLSWYTDNKHSEWVLRQCDGETPAFWGQGGPDAPPPGPHWLGMIPLDITNPEVRAQQLEYIDEQLAQKGKWMDAIALDGYRVVNVDACGVRLNNGSFVRRYSSTHDPQFVADIVDWTRWISKELHGRGLRVMPNVGPADFAGASLRWDDEAVLAITNATDGVMDEAGFTIGRPWWRDTIRFMLNLQAHGKAYYAINEVGGPNPPPDDPSVWRNATARIAKDERQLIVALYLLGKQQASAIEICCIQCYGIGTWFDEFGAPIGRPLSGPSLAESPQSVSQRSYSNGLVLVNVVDDGTTGQTLTVALPPGSRFKDLYDRVYDDSQPVSLAPQSGLVLVNA